MSIVSAQAAIPQSMPNKLSATKSNDPQPDLLNGFMQQVFDTKQPSQEQNSLPNFFQSQEKAIINTAAKDLELMTTKQLLSTVQAVENIHNQVNIMQSDSAHSSNPTVPEPSVLYLLHWLASGHLSYVATDLAAANIGHTKQAGSSEISTAYTAGNSIEQSIDADAYKAQALSANIAAGNEVRKSSSSTSQDSVVRDANAVASALIEQTSPYMKRRIIISQQENQTHVILRDYFLAPEQHVSELKSLLMNIKQNFSGTVQLTINGHHYGDLNKYR